MTDIDQRIKEALSEQPDFHAHYEIHGKWAQRHHDLLQACLALSQILLKKEQCNQMLGEIQTRLNAE